VVRFRRETVNPASDSGDPGWIRTSDLQLRRQEVAHFTAFHGVSKKYLFTTT
jgi:hypothetical protein